MVLRGITVFLLVMFILVLLIYPPENTAGHMAEVTLAVAWMDSPSGIYYERDFDWPTGEAVWVDFPAYYLHLGMLGPVAVAVMLLYSAGRSPTVQVRHARERGRRGAA